VLLELSEGRDSWNEGDSVPALSAREHQLPPVSCKGEPSIFVPPVLSNKSVCLGSSVRVKVECQ